MPNISSLLKDEIIGVARKEIRSEVASLRKTVTAHRSDIAALKRRTFGLEKEVRELLESKHKSAPPATVDDPNNPIRFSASNLALQRTRLPLSAAGCGLLVGASEESICNCEAGKAQPRAGHLATIALLRALGKKTAAAWSSELRLSAVKATAASPASKKP